MEIVIGALIALGVWVVVGVVVRIAVERRRTVCTPNNEMARRYRLICVDPEIGYKLVEGGTAISLAYYSDEGALVECLRLPVVDYPLLAADLQELVKDGRAYRRLRIPAVNRRFKMNYLIVVVLIFLAILFANTGFASPNLEETNAIAECLKRGFK